MDDQPASGRERSPLRFVKWVAIGVLGAAALFYGGLWIYANVINNPEEALTIADLDARLLDETTVPATTTTETTSVTATTPAATTTAPGTTTPVGSDTTALDGTWTIAEGTEVGYRVREILFGVPTDGVGRTTAVTGSLTLAGTVATAATFEVDMATVESDDPRRDGQFRGRIMNVAEHPTATFTLSAPIDFGAIPADGEQITTTASGELTLKGTTLPVTFEITAQRSGDRIGVLGAIPVVFADYGIDNPSITGITTEDEGLLEFVLVFER